MSKRTIREGARRALELGFLACALGGCGPDETGARAAASADVPAPPAMEPSRRSDSKASSPTARMSVPRRAHTATVLKDGRVLVVGGSLVGAPGEVYDPETGGWSQTKLAFFHWDYGHTATLLLDGRVLVAGGYTDPTIPNKSAQIFDPDSGKWSDVGPMLEPRRQGHVAATLLDGRILVAGGAKELGPVLDSTEIYDPVSNTWSEGAKLSEPRRDFALATLPDGRLLVAGGTDLTVSVMESVETYDPASNTWVPKAPTNHGYSQLILTVLSSPQWPAGAVLVTGSELEGTAEIYNIGTDTWMTVDQAPTSWGHTATALADGRILVTGGQDNSVTIFDPRTQKWQALEGMSSQRYFHTASVLPDGKVLLVGGWDEAGMPLDTAELYTPPGISCKANADCPSSFKTCVDGVCCNSACTGTCEACDGPVPGRCLPVIGPPHGERVCTATGGDDPCGPTCDGVFRGACNALGVEGTLCGLSCQNEAFSISICDGMGHCDATSELSCGAYACDGDTGCKSSCTAHDDCAQGFGCNARTQECRPSNACASVDDCPDPLVCDDWTKTCVARNSWNLPGAEDGCACSAPGGTRGPDASAAAALAALVFSARLARRRLNAPPSK